ncbi:hypothetical protein PVAND_000463 [Polypedilum vanderplanki]|uniref:Uncharacterized protein n=1 Tax=Polypedilum vanderplanki TaxID=319348 RepID=A0A9J6BKP2_POLVA|nr:hypothetical protein PVAND_000463 [Polypedilum vanderplanki]
MLIKVQNSRNMKDFNQEVGNEPTMYHPTADNSLYWSSKNLLIQILPSHYQNGHLILRCTAEVLTFYADYTEAFLETTRKEPIPERGKIESFIMIETLCVC